MKTPVLFLVFNRPEVTRVTFEKIRHAQPERLYIHADGPRATRPGDAALCQATRDICNHVDWPCQVHHQYRSENLGCGPGVAAALDWFFGEVEAGIVLEDDCAPTAAFFDFCTAMLARHRENPAIMHVAGMGFSWRGLPAGSAAFLSPVPFIWGWASWRRAWQHYRFALPSAETIEGVINRELPDRQMRAFWREKLDATRRGQIGTWDYQWVFALWSQRGSAVTPTSSLVENLGFGSESTHTATAATGYAPLVGPVPPPHEPLAHPARADAMREIHRRIFAPTAADRLDDVFRRPAWLWRLYLGLRRRLWA